MTEKIECNDLLADGIIRSYDLEDNTILNSPSSSENKPTLIVVEGMENVRDYDDDKEKLPKKRICIISLCISFSLGLLIIAIIGAVALFKSHNRITIPPISPFNETGLGSSSSNLISEASTGLTDDYPVMVVDDVSSDPSSDVGQSEYHSVSPKETP